MEMYDDRPVSVYDNLNAPPNYQANTSKSEKSSNTVPSLTSQSLATTIQSATATATATRTSTVANGEINSPIYADLTFKFNSNKQPTTNLAQQQQQQYQQQQQTQHQQQQYPSQLTLQQQTIPSLCRQYPSQMANQQVLSNFTDQTTSPLQLATHTTSPLHGSNSNSSCNNHYTNTNNNRQTQTNANANASIEMPTSAPITEIVTSVAATAPNASPAQRPLSQHSQTELNEASHSIAAVKAALNDAKSKFFGLNGYAHDHHQDAPHDDTSNITHSNNTSNTHESQPKQYVHTPRLLIDQEFPNVQIVTTTPTPPHKPQPKYQNIPENSAIFRKHQELPPKPVEAIATSSGMIATTTPTQLVGCPSITPNDPVSAHSSTSSPSPTSLLDAAKISPSSTHAYKQIPLNDMDATQPSQAVYMSTTVPQNIKGSKIAGRHTPTRNSLRHSRMLVVNNKTYPATQHPNPMNFKCPNLARWLLILEILVGLLISFLAIWIFCLAPSTAIQYNPYWSGLVLLVAGILGLVLVRYQRIKRHKVRENCFKFLRANSYMLALLAVLLCCVALIGAAVQHARLSANNTYCAPTNILLELGSCTCTFNANVDPAQMANGDELDTESMTDDSYKVEYHDLSCKEVRSEWTTILVMSIVLNSIGFILSFGYIVLLACCKHNSKRFYTSVHTSTF